MEGFIAWLKEHPIIMFGSIAVGVFLIARSVSKQNGQDASATSGSGAQGDLGSGQVVSAGGYTFVPTSPGQYDSSTQSGDMNPNTAQDLQALTGFLQQVQAPAATPATPAGSGAPASDTSGSSDSSGDSAGASSGGLLGGLFDPSGGGLFDTSGLQGLGAGSLSGTITLSGNPTIKVKAPKTTKHTHGTPNQAPGVPHVAPHPHNPSPLPPTRTAPVTHPAQGKTHPVAGPIAPTVPTKTLFKQPVVPLKKQKGA